MRLIYFTLGFKRCCTHILLADRRFKHTPQNEAVATMGSGCAPSASSVVPIHWEVVLASQAVWSMGLGGV